jgi:glutaredoxin
MTSRLAFIVSLFLIFIPFVSHAEIYSWTDENGQRHFGDAPKESDKAEPVILEINSYEAVTYEALPSNETTKNNQVIMYATSWCGYCKKARTYFRQNRINFVEYDIEKDRHAKRRYDRLGATGIPVILFGKNRMNGFSAARFERLYYQ